MYQTVRYHPNTNDPEGGQALAPQHAWRGSVKRQEAPAESACSASFRYIWNQILFLGIFEKQIHFKKCIKNTGKYQLADYKSSC